MKSSALLFIVIVSVESAMKVMVPVNKTEEIGIRDIIDKETALDAVRKFKEIKPYFNDNWNRRYRENMLKIKTGNIMDTMDVLKSLMIREKERGLSTAERKMLNNSKNIFMSEIVLSQAMLKEEIEEYLNQVIEEEINK